MADQVTEQLKAEGMSAESVADVQPLLANANFRKDADYQAKTAQDAAKAAALARSTGDDFLATVTLFASLMTASKAIASKFPEVAAEMKQVATSATAAMGKVKNNPVTPVAAPPAPTPASFAPIPAPTHLPPTPVPAAPPKIE